MLHTMFRENWSTGSGEADFDRFYHIISIVYMATKMNKNRLNQLVASIL